MPIASSDSTSKRAVESEFRHLRWHAVLIQLALRRWTNPRNSAIDEEQDRGRSERRCRPDFGRCKHPHPGQLKTDCAIMVRVVWRSVAIILCAISLWASPSRAQNPEQKPAPQGKPEAKEGAGRVNEIAEASRVMTGPAARAECVWLGIRAVNLMWHDDLDTAFRHLDLYDRFGCPGEHIQISFRCVVRQGDIDQKDQKLVEDRVKTCWLNPALPPVAGAATAAEKGGTK